MSYAADVRATLAQLALSPEYARVCALTDADFTPEMAAAILDEAARFSEHVLDPINRPLDLGGCSLDAGRVRLQPGHLAAWRAFADGGWMTLTVDPAHGGQGLPMVALAAVHALFERGSVALCMLPGGTRAASRLIDRHASEAIKTEWLPRLAAGDWSATICISEAGAGSDVARILTRARCDEQGVWRVTGEKMWISYGDHDATTRIGHFVLARTEPDDPSARGLSLFLVPDSIEGERNRVFVRRIEEKLGMHGSPTCALGFEEARGVLIGQPGQGLPQLFAMIVAMRLSVGVQGLGIAAGALAVARLYTAERRQGGVPSQPPVPLVAHADVRRTLADMAAMVEALRGLVLATSALVDLSELEADPDARAQALLAVEFLLPIVKTCGAETAFDTADMAIQLLGGAGYTTEWPVEQYLRDARVLAIYEGTSGVQAIDLLHRRVLGKNGSSLAAFVSLVETEIAAADAALAAPLRTALDLLASAVDAMRSRTPDARDWGASPFFRLAISVAQGWIALRLARSSELELATAGRHMLALLPSKAQHAAALADIPPPPCD